MKGTNNKLICITGPTGSGKSDLCKYLSEYGFPVLIADHFAREAVEKGSRCLEELVEAFGDGILKEDGSLNRSALAKIAFVDPEKTALLNRITHPHIMKRIRSAIHNLYELGERVVILEVPLLKESGLLEECDAVILVTANPEIRKQRIMERDHIPPEAADLRISAQTPLEGEGMILFDNSGNPENLKVFAKELAKRFGSGV